MRNVQIYSTNLKVAQSKNNINNSDAFVSKNEKRNTFLKSFLPFERGYFFEVLTSDIKASLFYIFYIPKRNSALKKNFENWWFIAWYNTVHALSLKTITSFPKQKIKLKVLSRHKGDALHWNGEPHHLFCRTLILWLSTDSVLLIFTLTFGLMSPTSMSRDKLSRRDKVVDDVDMS